MELIYSNFDNLDISFQGAFPIAILEQLAAAREQAQRERREVLAELGAKKVKVMVAETGARGGYRYRFDTGLDGETWFVAHSTNSKNYNIRVSVKSLKLALSGYKAVKGAIIKRLIDFEAVGLSAYFENLTAKPESLSGKISAYFLPMERISRLDYCFDFVTDAAFMPQPENFVAHQRCKKHVYGEHGYISSYSALNGDRINTIRIGEMPGRQAVIYNKTKEIVASSKKYWWDIWGVDPEPFKEGFKQIWRVEVRAGRDELDKWSLKRFKDFEFKAGDIIADILKAIRYTNPLKDDLNRSRWPMHEIWDISLKQSFKALAPYRSGAIRENIIRDYRDNVISGYRDRLIGNLIGYSAAQGRDVSELVTVAEEFEALIQNMARDEVDELIRKHEKLEERFQFLI